MIVYKREENRESETIKVVQSKWKKKIREKEEKKDRCTHDVFSRPSTFLRMYFNIVNLWNIRSRVSHVSIMKREIGGQPFDDNDLFFLQWWRCSFVARPCYVCIIIGQNVAHEISFEYFFLILGNANASSRNFLARIIIISGRKAENT